MMQQLILVVAIVLGVVMVRGEQMTRSPAVLLEAAIKKEVVDGDLKGAIALYGQLATSADREVAAKALVRMGQCYARMGSAEALTMFERVISGFPEQKTQVEEAAGYLKSARSSGAEISTRLAFSVRDERIFTSISRDGRYAASQLYGGRIILQDLVTGTERIVAKASGPAETVGSAIVSPDGKRVVYRHNPVGSRLGDGARWIVVDASGSNPRPLGSPGTITTICDWTSDGTKLLATRSAYAGGPLTPGRPEPERLLITVATGETSSLPNQGNCGRFSPDGRFIAAESRLPLGIAVTPVAGGPKEYLDQMGNGIDPFWSRDGSRVLFSRTRSEAPWYRSGNDLWSVRVVNGRKAGEPELVKKNVGRVIGVTKNDEYYYATHTMTADLYMVDLDPSTSMPTSRPKQLTTNFDNWGASWSPDGQWLAYFSDRGAGNRALVLRPLNGADPVVTPIGFPADVPGLPRDRPAWTPDGQSLIVRNMNGPQLFRVDVKTGAVTPIVRLEKPPPNTSHYHGRVRIDADGRTVFYVSGLDRERKSIVRASLDGGDAQVLFTSTGTFLSGPSLSPDGTMLAFSTSHESFPNTDDVRVMVMPVTGGQPREVCRINDHVQDPIWSKDGQRLIFTTYNNPYSKDKKADVWVVPVAGGQPKAMNLGLHWAFYPDLSPDGRHLVLRDENFNNELWVIRSLFSK